MSKRGIRAWRAAVYATMPIAFVAATAVQSLAQGKVTSPKEFFGHTIGDDYWLPNYDQFLAYWKKIDGESKLGRHRKSIDPSMPTRPTLYRSPITPYSPMGA